MVEHLLQVAVRGLSQTLSSQGWSLHKAILQSLKKCYFNFFENIFLPANTDLNILEEKHQEHVNFIFVYMHSIHVQCFPPRILLCELEVKTLHNEKN